MMSIVINGHEPDSERNEETIVILKLILSGRFDEVL